MAKLEEKRMNDSEWLYFLQKYAVDIDDLEDTLGFLDAVLTHAEREEFPKRFKILEELFKNNLSQRDIAAELNVSIANVTRGSNTIKSIQPHHDLKSIIEKISNNKLK
jgi:TrpR family trp operon transcriptional repressor